MPNSDQIARARAVPIERIITERGIKLRGRIDCVGPCPKCGGTDRFAINIKKQVFNCRGCNVGGDVIALVQQLDECNFQKACETLVGDHKTTAQLEQKTKKAAWLWKQSQPLSESCLAGRYLRRRGFTEEFPKALRFLPARNNYPPALIAAFGLGFDVPPAVHITRLTEEADRERSETAKIIIGTPRGHPIELSETNDLLAIDVCEGIENGLKYLQLRHCGVWVAGNAGLLPSLRFPSWTECVSIFADPDRIGIAKARELAQSARAQGIPDVRLKRIGS